MPTEAAVFFLSATGLLAGTATIAYLWGYARGYDNGFHENITYWTANQQKTSEDYAADYAAWTAQQTRAPLEQREGIGN